MEIEKYEKSIKTCVFCPKMCRFVCPVARATKSESTTPSGKCLMAYLLLKKAIKYDEEVAGLMYKCTTCRLCKSWCILGVDMKKITESARLDAVNARVAPRTVAEINEKVLQSGTPFEPSCKLFSPGEKLFRRNADVAYFAGCATSYLRPEIGESMISILKESGVNFTLIKNEKCCGSPLLSLGLRDTAKKLAEHNAKVIKETGCRTVVTSCPGCYVALKLSYGTLAPLGVEVVHATEYIRQLMESGRIKPKKVAESVTYHDPCHLVRGDAPYDSEIPREILRSLGAQIKEMEWNKENARCCGGGGGLRRTNPEISEAIAAERVKDAEKTGAGLLVTACPMCKHMLMEKGRTKVVDIAELVSLR